METIRSRAAILPFAGDPFLLHYWLNNFKTKWYDEIDKLYIICDTIIESPVLDYIEKLCSNDPKIVYVYNKEKGQHGDKILRGLLAATEKYVMLIEDDCYIIQPGKIDECFKLLESGNYDIVGSKRGSCHAEILDAAQRVYGIPYEGVGDQGCNFWPNLFFIERQLLLNTDRDYNSRAWVQGEIIAPLNNYAVIAPVIASDTFVSTSLQLRAMVPESRIFYCKQYHAHPDDYDHYTKQIYLFDGQAPWTHIGSLSSGVDGAIMDDQGRSLARRLLMPPQGPTVLPAAWCDITSDFSKMEWERRVQWWLTFWETRDPDEIPEFAELYKKGLDQMISQFQLKIKRIRQRQAIYKERLGL